MEFQEEEWQDMDDVDSTDIDISEEIEPELGTPVLQINMEIIWYDGEEDNLSEQKFK